MPDIDENEIPAFLKGGNEIDLNNLEAEEDDFPTLEEDDEPAVTEEDKADDAYQAAKEDEKTPKLGSNSGVQADQLRAFIERIERLEEEKKAFADDIKEIFAEAKGTGYSVKTMRAILKLRKKDKAERDEEEQMLALYLWALGMAD
jgi:uncharacterized protein (UPF0335 family)